METFYTIYIYIYTEDTINLSPQIARRRGVEVMYAITAPSSERRLTPLRPSSANDTPTIFSSPARPGVSLLPLETQSVRLVEEDDTRLNLPRQTEHRSNHHARLPRPTPAPTAAGCGASAGPLHEGGGLHADESGTALLGDGSGQKRLSAARGAVDEDSRARFDEACLSNKVEKRGMRGGARGVEQT